VHFNYPGCILAPVSSLAELEYIKQLADGEGAEVVLLGVFKDPLAAQECTDAAEDCFEGWMTFEGSVPNDTTLWSSTYSQPDGIGNGDLVATIANTGFSAMDSIMFDSTDSTAFEYAAIKCYLDPTAEIRPPILNGLLTR
jgi:hypothetical protein